MMTNSKDYIISNHIVCYLDILGQQDMLKKWEQMPSKMNSDYLQAIKDSFGKVMELRQCFHGYFMGVNKYTPRDFYNGFRIQNMYDRFGKEKVEDFLKTRENVPQIHTRVFSDSIFFYSKLPDSDGKISLSNLFNIILGCALTMCWTYSKGTFFRGGITLGPGISDDECFYGPALADAYKLESQIAKYPRMVISPSIINLLNTEINHKNEILKIHEITAKDCIKKLIYKDADKVYMVDFLNTAIRNFLERDTVKLNYLGNPCEKILRIVKVLHSHFQRSQNPKLTNRYKRLERYVKSQEPNWQGLKISENISDL